MSLHSPIDGARQPAHIDTHLLKLADECLSSPTDEAIHKFSTKLFSDNYFILDSTTLATLRGKFTKSDGSGPVNEKVKIIASFLSSQDPDKAKIDETRQKLGLEVSAERDISGEQIKKIMEAVIQDAELPPITPTHTEPTTVKDVAVTVRDTAKKVGVLAKLGGLFFAKGTAAATAVAGAGAVAGAVVATAGVVLVGTGIASAHEALLDNIILAPPTEAEVRQDLALTEALFPKAPRQTVKERRIQMTLNNLRRHILEKNPKITPEELAKLEEGAINKLYPPSKNEGNEEGAKAKKAAKNEKSEKGEKAEKNGKSEKTEKSAKGDKGGKAEKSEKVEKGEKADKGKKGEKGDKVDPGKAVADVAKAFKNKDLPLGAPAKGIGQAAQEISDISSDISTSASIIPEGREMLAAAHDLIIDDLTADPDKSVKTVKALATSTRGVGEALDQIGSLLSGPTKEMFNALVGVSIDVSTVAASGAAIAEGALSAYKSVVDFHITNAPSESHVKSLIENSPPASPKLSLEETRINMTVEAIASHSAKKGTPLKGKELEIVKLVVATKLYPDRIQVDSPSSPESSLKITILPSKMSVIGNVATAVFTGASAVESTFKRVTKNVDAAISQAQTKVKDSEKAAAAVSKAAESADRAAATAHTALAQSLEQTHTPSADMAAHAARVAAETETQAAAAQETAAKAHEMAAKAAAIAASSASKSMREYEAASKDATRLAEEARKATAEAAQKSQEAARAAADASRLTSAALSEHPDADLSHLAAASNSAVENATAATKKAIRAKVLAPVSSDIRNTVVTGKSEGHMNREITKEITDAMHPMAEATELATGVASGISGARDAMAGVERLVKAENAEEAAKSMKDIQKGVDKMQKTAATVSDFFTDNMAGTILTEAASGLGIASMGLTLTADAGVLSGIRAVATPLSSLRSAIDSSLLKPPPVREVIVDLRLAQSLSPKAQRQSVEERRIELTLNAIYTQCRSQNISLTEAQKERMKLAVTKELYPDMVSKVPKATPAKAAPQPVAQTPKATTSSAKTTHWRHTYRSLRF